MGAYGVLLAVAVLCTAAPGQAPDWTPGLISAEEAAEGFYPLFNGNDLDGWTIRGDNKRAFAARDGVLATTGEGGGDWLFTAESYENFVLRYEYRVFQQDDNSGVAVRATAWDNPAFTGMEIQILHPVEVPHVGSSGALYGAVAPAVAADKPLGEWNAVEVTCDGPLVQTIMNGRELYDVNVNTFDSPDKEHAPLADRAKAGYIAIQDYGKRVELRRIRIRPLPGGAEWQPIEGLFTIPQGPTDFELRFSFKPSAGAKGRLQFLSHWNEPLYEIVIDNHDTEQFTGSIVDKVAASELRAADERWNHMHVAAKGANIRVAVNGKTVVDFVTTERVTRPDGLVKFQPYGGLTEIKDIETKPLIQE